MGFQPPPKKGWAVNRTIGGVEYMFKKEREKSVFLYSCSHRLLDGAKTIEGCTGFYSERDLTPDEAVRLRQFDHFIGRN
jgi:hypothetical protein